MNSTVILTSDKGARCEISLIGAQVLSFKTAAGVERIYQGANNTLKGMQPDETGWGSSAPLLFPQISGIDAKKYHVDGKEFETKRHGLLIRDSRAVFTVLPQTKNNSITLRMTANEFTKQFYPFDNWILDVTYTVDGDSLSTNSVITNNSKENISFAYGNHPAYALPSADNGYVQFRRVNPVMGEKTNAKTDKPVPVSTFANNPVKFENIYSATVEVLIRDRSDKLAPIVETEKTCPTVCVWGKGGSFVCIESFAADTSTFDTLIGKNSTRNEVKNISGHISVAPGQQYVHRDMVRFVHDEKFLEATKQSVTDIQK